MYLVGMICCVLLAIVVYFYMRFKNIKNLYDNEKTKTQELINREISFLKKEGTLEQIQKDLKEKVEEIHNLTQKIIYLEKTNASIEQDKLYIKQEKEKLENLQTTIIANSKSEFQNIANSILKTTTENFTQTSKTEIGNIVTNFSNNLNSFKDKVEKQTKEFDTTKGALENQLKNIVDQSGVLKDQTNKLIDALKTDSKFKGDLGENILEIIFEQSGLEKNITYFTQQQENLKRTDFQILLPGDKWIIVDSKVPLNAYMEYCDNKNEEESDILLDKHVDAIKQFISDLSKKEYHKKFEDTEQTINPDFVLMFVYPEEAYIAALRHDENLTNYAWKKNIAIVSATSLMHTIKIIEKLWNIHKQIENYQNIIDLANRFRNKLGTFVLYIEKFGNSLNSSIKNYNDLVNNINGQGNLQKIVAELAEYGINGKEIEINKINQITEIQSLDDKNM